MLSSAEILNTVIFYLCAFLVVVGAVFTILSNRIIYSLFFAVIVFFCTGIVFYLLNAEYNAIVQIAVYGVAVPILLALAIMFTDYKIDKDIYLAFSPRFIFTITASVLFVLTLFNIMLISSSVIEWLFTPQSSVDINRYEMFNAISNGLYMKFFFSFELISLIILTVIVGLSTLNLRKGKKRG